MAQPHSGAKDSSTSTWERTEPSSLRAEMFHFLWSSSVRYSTNGSTEYVRATDQPLGIFFVHSALPVFGFSCCTSSCSPDVVAAQEETAISFGPPANAEGKQAEPYFFLSHSFLPECTSYAVPDCERPTISVSPVRASSSESVLSNRSPSATFALQPFLPVVRSTCWSWLHVALSLTPFM